MKEVIVHTFKMGDVEDPDLYAAEPMIKWENTEQGKWVMNNAAERPTWIRITHFDGYTGFEYQIIAKFTPEKYTYYSLKYE